MTVTRYLRIVAITFSLCIAVGYAGVVITTSACTKAPPSLSPAGAQAFNNTRVIKGLDLLRDVAIDANAQQPPIVTTDTTRTIVRFHQSALLTIRATPSGWKATVSTGLDEVVKNLTPADARTVAPYVALVKAIIAEVN